MGCWDSHSQASFGNRNICYNFLNDRFYTRFSILYNNNIFSIDYSIASGLGIACTNTRVQLHTLYPQKELKLCINVAVNRTWESYTVRSARDKEARGEHSTDHGHEILSFLPCLRDACCHSFSASAFVFE